MIKSSKEKVKKKDKLAKSNNFNIEESIQWMDFRIRAMSLHAHCVHGRNHAPNL